jgi:hypothetical protein
MKRVATALMLAVLAAPLVAGGVFAKERANDNNNRNRHGQLIEMPQPSDQVFERQNDRANDNRPGDRARGK